MKRIHLDFAYKYNDGHLGARKVWRDYLPRLKYHNPAVSMTVNRHPEQAGHSTLTVFYAQPPRSSSTSASPSPKSFTTTSTRTSEHSVWDRMDIIDMKHKQAPEILKQLLEVTKGVSYEPSMEELAEVEEAAEDRRRRDRDKRRQQKYNEIRRQELALLEHAKGSTT